jgi:hypothetical protein
MKKKKKRFKKNKRKRKSYKISKKKNNQTKKKKKPLKVFKKNKQINKKKKSKRKKIFLKSKKNKSKKLKKNKIRYSSRATILSIIRFLDKFKFRFNLDLDKNLQNFFQSISNKISGKVEDITKILEEEKERKKKIKIKEMQQEKVDAAKKSKLEKQSALEAKQKEFKDEIRFERVRKIELQKFIRLEQAEVRKEQAEKQRKFLEQIKLEKKIDQFRKREISEIKSIEKFVLSQERESYTDVQARIDKIKQKYQALRDQKIRERVEQLGVKIEEDDDRTTLLEKEKLFNLERQKIEYALESFFRSAHSLCFQINKRYIPKYLSIMRVIDKRFETGEIYIKWDDAPDDEWLILIYIKNNSPDEGIIIEDKTRRDKNISMEFQPNEIFKASDVMVDSLTKLLDTERKKRKNK